MFIECHDGSYFNTDKAVSYFVGEVQNYFSVEASISDGYSWKLGLYDTEDRAKTECKRIVEWIRSTVGLEASSKEYLNKFIYHMPEDKNMAV